MPDKMNYISTRSATRFPATAPRSFARDETRNYMIITIGGAAVVALNELRQALANVAADADLPNDELILTRYSPTMIHVTFPAQASVVTVKRLIVAAFEAVFGVDS